MKDFAWHGRLDRNAAVAPPIEWYEGPTSRRQVRETTTPAGAGPAGVMIPGEPEAPRGRVAR
jgi:hypothetical protein